MNRQSMIGYKRVNKYLPARGLENILKKGFHESGQLDVTGLNSIGLNWIGFN